jgi:hypothetical protein
MENLRLEMRIIIKKKVEEKEGEFSKPSTTKNLV